MSKCDIDIEFDRIDRTYRGGEKVTGSVKIQVNQDCNCRKIALNHFWQTHGRGNTAAGTKHEIVLSSDAALQAGETLVLPFEFATELQPLTYRGTLINVDHYVKVYVDLPWKFDPKQSEEFVLLGGERPPGFDGQRGELVEKAAAPVPAFLKWLLYAFLAIFGVVLSIFATLLLPFILIGGAIWFFMQRSVKGKVGDVDVQMPHSLVAPGEKFPVSIRFTPQKTFDINSIALKIAATESATSGSGTDAKTYHHTVYEKTHVLQPAGQMVSGRTFDQSVGFELPDIPAYSLSESSNVIKWTAEVRIDIPRAPDWKQSKELQMVPHEFVGPPIAVSDLPQDVRSADKETKHETTAEQYSVPADSAQSAKVPGYIPPFTDHADNTSVEDSQPAQDYHGSTDNSDYPSIVPLVQKIKEADRFGTGREDAVTLAEGTIFDLTVIVDRIVSTYSLSEEADHRNGKTVTGKIANTDMEVELYTAEISNKDIEQLTRGDAWSVYATIRKWDNLYERLELIEAI